MQNVRRMRSQRQELSICDILTGYTIQLKWTTFDLIVNKEIKFIGVLRRSCLTVISKLVYSNQVVNQVAIKLVHCQNGVLTGACSIGSHRKVNDSDGAALDSNWLALVGAHLIAVSTSEIPFP
jgi:hypothetical protein